MHHDTAGAYQCFRVATFRRGLKRISVLACHQGEICLFELGQYVSSCAPTFSPAYLTILRAWCHDIGGWVRCLRAERQHFLFDAAAPWTVSCVPTAAVKLESIRTPPHQVVPELVEGMAKTPHGSMSNPNAGSTGPNAAILSFFSASASACHTRLLLPLAGATSTQANHSTYSLVQLWSTFA